MKSVLKIGDKRIVVEHAPDTVLRMEGGVLKAGNPATRSVESRLKRAMSEEGVRIGDAVKWMTDKLGIEQCPRCKAWQRILNHATRLGISETVRQMKEAAHGSR